MQNITTSDSPEAYAAEYEKLSHAVKSLIASTTEAERNNWITIIKILSDKLYASIEPTT